MKIYTKTGDRGTTSLFGGKKVTKDDLRIQAYGNVDELNSLTGVIVSGLEARFNQGADTSPALKDLVKKLARIQEELMVLGSDLATPVDVRVKIPRVTKVFITRLEKEIDGWEKKLPKLKNFILPGGSIVSSWLHLARSTTRRAERSIVVLSNGDKINLSAAVYINRLSDWFFVLARYINMEEKTKETIWKGRGK